MREGQKRLFTKRDRTRLKLILRGKRFGFSLEEIRQLLEMYDVSDPEQTQLKETYAIAQKHLQELKNKRDELDEVIADFEDQIKWGESILRASGSIQNAAE